MKRTGRPPLDDDDDSVPVHLTLTSAVYDELHSRARRDRVSVPERVRRDLQVARAVIRKELKNTK